MFCIKCQANKSALRKTWRKVNIGKNTFQVNNFITSIVKVLLHNDVNNNNNTAQMPTNQTGICS